MIELVFPVVKRAPAALLYADADRGHRRASPHDLASDLYLEGAVSGHPVAPARRGPRMGPGSPPARAARGWGRPGRRAVTSTPMTSDSTRSEHAPGDRKRPHPAPVGRKVTDAPWLGGERAAGEEFGEKGLRLVERESKRQGRTKPIDIHC
jgi:hypothetical protein